MTGFTVIQQEGSGGGTARSGDEYLCIASLNGTYQVVEYHLRRKQKQEQTIFTGRLCVYKKNDRKFE